MCAHTLRCLIGFLAITLLMGLLQPAALAQNSADCLICHQDHSLTVNRDGNIVSLYINPSQLQRSVHASLECQDCHAGLNPQEIPHAKVIRPVDCLTCHDADGYQKSVHARLVMAAQSKGKKHPGAACRDCHGTHDILAPGDPQSSVNQANVSKTCGKCHQTQEAHFARSAHGVALAAGVKGAPTCVDCHGGHDIEQTTSESSPMYKHNEAAVCLRCHVDNPDVRQRVGVSAGFIAGYENSIHGRLVSSGNLKAAVCSDCHGAHDIQGGSMPVSGVYKLNIPRTCGKCHGAIEKTYNDSIHGVALRDGNLAAPSCTDCHGEHQIYAPENPLSRVAPKNVSAMVCGTCHSSVRLAEKYNLAADRFRTFEDSYHGLAAREGAIEVANCASCHGDHDIKPSSDPTSRINKANLAATCGQCHKGATESFAKGPVHIELARAGNEALLYWIRSFYISLIAVVVGGMFVHNAVDFMRKSRQRLALRRGLFPQPHGGSETYLRMTLAERLQHGCLLISFFVLVFTGFMLKFPDAWWVTPIRRWSPRLFEVRSVVHRTAGVVLILTSLFHVYYILFVKRGRQLIRDLVPKLTDVSDAWRLLLYNFGWSKSRPVFGRFGYVEKVEYWALVWGTIVMAGTGIILWFDTFFVNLLTKLGWDAARMIHYYEAWLATLAIVVWHFYFVIFNPSVYPMNTAWWDGMLSEEEMAEEHPLELEKIRAEQLANQDRTSTA